MSQTVWSNHPDGVAILKDKIENKEKQKGKFAFTGLLMADKLLKHV